MKEIFFQITLIIREIYNYLYTINFFITNDFINNFIVESATIYFYFYLTCFDEKIILFLNSLNFFFQLLILFFSNFFFFFFKKLFVELITLSIIQEIPFFFFFGFFFFFTTLVSFFFISYLGLYGIFWINCIALFCFWFSSLFYFNNYFIFNTITIIKIGSWFSLFHNYSVDLEFFIDSISFCYILLTLSIAYFVQLYTFSYFRYEPLVERLILFLNSFIFSMIFFVSVGNLILLFLGWELIGLTSFILINFWVTRKGTLKAAFKAFVFNKISDIFFFIFIILSLLFFNSLEIYLILEQMYLLSDNVFVICNLKFSLIELLCFFLSIAAFIKSAQIGVHIWLPDSMEAPVPASALIHSATLVSAGLFLFLRFNVLFELSNKFIFFIGFIGALTSLYGGMVAMYQSDIKRILAYSTISHCGFLIVSFFFFSSEITIFYLYVHGFFKAGVFLCVGNIIRFSSGYQDFRRMGFFFKYLPNDFFFITIGLFNLGGLPFSLGFFMKHSLLIILQENSYWNSFLLTLCLFGALTGLFYSYKIIYYVFFDFKKAKSYIYKKIFSLPLIINYTYIGNNSKMAVFAVKYLFFLAYFICWWFYINIIANQSFFDSYLFVNVNFFDLLILNKIFLWNLLFLNYWIILLLISLFFSLWRWIYYYLIIYKNIFCLLTFFFFYKIY